MAKDGIALTRREQDVLRLLMRGLRNAEIGRKLGIREQTVKDHVSVLLEKFGARSRVELVVLATKFSW